MRLMLLEDDDILGEALKDYLQAEGNVVDWFTHIAHARAAVREPYDTLLIDWRLPDGSGIDWLSQLRQEGVTTPALIITARDLLRERIQGLDSGADDYIVKPFDPAELAARIRAVRRRVTADGAIRRCFGPVEVDMTAMTASVGGLIVDLTAREWALLDALASRAGRIVSKTDLEALVTGLDSEVNSNAIEVHIFKLRRKLGRNIVETVRGRGYRMQLSACVADPESC
jgi:two-component system OmpR family response regulator